MISCSLARSRRTKCYTSRVIYVKSSAKLRNCLVCSVSCCWTSEMAESGSDLFDFSGPEDELASAPLPPPEESGPSTSLLDEVYTRDEYYSDGDSRIKKTHSTLQQLPSKPNSTQTPTRPRAYGLSRKRYTAVESSSSSADELNDDYSERSSKKPRKEDSIKSMLKLLC